MTNLNYTLFDGSSATKIATTNIIVPLQINFRVRDYVSAVTGMSPVVLHISQKSKRKRISLDVHVTKKTWDVKKQRSKKDEDLNLYLDNIYKKATEIRTFYRLNNLFLSLDRFIEEFEAGFSKNNFLEFARFFLEETEHTYSQGTYNRYSSVLAKMKRYKEEWLFSDLDYGFMQDYTNHLLKINKESTVMANLSAIRKFLNAAKAKNIKMPLEIKQLKIKNIKSNPVHLEIDELQKMWKYYFSDFIPQKHQVTLGYFLFACFTGLRHSDLMQIERQYITDKIKLISKKTNEPITVNVTKKAKQVADQCHYLFQKKITLQYYNRQLKDIAKFLEIKKNLTTHVGRHTFATNYIRMGGKETDLMNILGHSSLRMTEVYVNISYDESMRNIDLIDNVF